MCVIVFYLLQEWAEELFNLASNLLVQNMSREACLEKAYVVHTHMHATRTHKHKHIQYTSSHTQKCKSTIPKINMKIRSARTKKMSLIRSAASGLYCILHKQKQQEQANEATCVKETHD